MRVCVHVHVHVHTHVHVSICMCATSYVCKEIKRIGIFSPYIMVTGNDIVHPTQYFIVCENQVLTENTTFAKALVALFAWYYVMDIEYPKSCRNTFNFIEAKCLRLPSTGNFTASSIQVNSSMEQFDIA